MIFKYPRVFGLVLGLIGFSLAASPARAVSTGKPIKTREDVLEDFSNFLISFGSGDEFRRVSMDTVIAVHRLVIDLADQKSPYEMTKVKADRVLADFCDTSVVKHLKVSWTNWKGAEAEYVDKKYPEKCFRFVFARNGGRWFLKTVYDDRIELKDSTAGTNDAKMKSCLNMAEKYQALAEKNEGLADANQYDRMLYGYLCAAQNGSGKAAIAANGLAGSGMSRSYSDGLEMKMLQIGISKNYAMAFAYMAYYECELRDSLGLLKMVNNRCKDLQSSYRYLSKAIMLGYNDALYTLGAWFETGRLGKEDLRSAMSCYKLALERGDQGALDGIKRLGERGVDTKLPSRSCPINGYFGQE